MLVNPFLIRGILRIMLKCSIYNNVIQGRESRYEIYNSMTKARIAVDDENYLQKVVDANNDDDSIQLLVQNGFLVEDKIDEINALSYAFNKRYFNSSSLGLILLPTMQCNFDCPYCFEKPFAHYIKNETKDYFKIVAKYLENTVYNFRNVELNFFGGEPLLKKKEMEEFTKYVETLSNKMGFSVHSTIITNGSLIDEDVMESLLRVNCNLIQITIDGSRFQHDTTRVFKTGKPSFDILIDKIKFVAGYVACNQNLKLLIRFNLNNTSLSDVEKTLSLFEPRIRKNISLMFRPVFETAKYHVKNSNYRNELDPFNQLGHNMGFAIYKNMRTYLACESCGDTNVIHVLPDLSLWKCINDLSCNEAKMGFLSEDGKAVWDVSNVLKWYHYSDFLKDEKCKGCSISPDCLGGCLLYYIKTGNHRCSSIEERSSQFRY